MKTFLLIFTILLIVLESANCQSNLFVDKDHQIFQYGVESQTYADKLDSFFIFGVVEQDAGLSPFHPYDFKLKQIDFDGNIIKEKTILFDCNVLININKIGKNYLINYYKVIDDKPNFETLLINQDFQIIEENLFQVNYDLYKDDINLLTASKLYSVGETNILFYPFPINQDTSLLIKLKFTKDGYFTERKDQIEELNFLFLRQPFKKLDSDHIILPTSKRFIEFDLEMNEIKNISFIGLNLPVYLISSMAFANNSQNYIGVGTNINLFPSFARPWISLFDSTFVFKPSLSKNLMFVNPNPLVKPEFYFYNTLDECLVQEEDGSFTSMTSYSINGDNLIIENGIWGDTVTGRIIISKFTSDLKLICQNVYSIPDKKINLDRGKYLGNGEYLVTGSIDSIERNNKNSHKSFNPFIGIIKPNCGIPWAEPTLSKLKPIDHQIISVSFYPNPTTEIIKAEFQENYNHMFCKIYNTAGVEVWSGKSIELKKGIKIESFPKTTYNVLFNGKFVGRFVKI